MNKLKNIIQGYWFWLWQPEHIKVKAAARMEICKACHDKKIPKWLPKWTPQWFVKLLTVCGLCGCVLMAKTASPDEVCPALKWGKMKL